MLQRHSRENPYYNVQVYDLDKKTICYDTHDVANNAEHDIVPCIQMNAQRTRCLLAGVARRYRVVSMVDGKVIYTAPEHKGFQGKSVEDITKLPQYSGRDGVLMEQYKRIVGKDYLLKHSLARIVAYWTSGDQEIVTTDWTDENEIYDAHKHTLIGRLPYSFCDTIMFAQDASRPDVSWALTKEQRVDDIGVWRLPQLVQKGSQAPTALAQS